MKSRTFCFRTAPQRGVISRKAKSAACSRQTCAAETTRKKFFRCWFWNCGTANLRINLRRSQLAVENRDPRQSRVARRAIEVAGKSGALEMNGVMENRTGAEFCSPARPGNSTKLQKALRIRGIHWLITRFGGKRLCRLSFDEKYKSGDWAFGSETRDLVQLVEKYSSSGHVLALGCGAAPIAGALNPVSYRSFLGIDLSSEAIAIARKQANNRIRFETGDMVSYRCSRKYDVILFPDSLYYVPFFARKRLLVKLCRGLTARGKIIVVIAHPDRYAGILKMIRQNFAVDVDRELEGTKRHVLVFSRCSEPKIC